jgi:hypothetical protein
MAARFYQFLNRNSTLIHVVESKYFTIFMLIVIVSNTFVMIFETYDLHYHKYNSFFLLTEKIYLCIYIIECSLKLWVGYIQVLKLYVDHFRFIHGDIFKFYGIVLIYLLLLLVLLI